MADITMSLDDTLELDTVVEESVDALDPISNIDSTFNQKGIRTYTGILDPTEPGKYTINVNGQELSIKVRDPNNIPSDGLSGYSITDPNDNLNLTDTSISISGSNINSDGRVYKNLELSNYEEIIYQFDFNMSKCDKGQGGVTWGNQEDVTRDSGMDYAGFFFGTNPRVTLANSNGDGAEISGFNKNEDYTVELTWNINDSTLQAELFDSNRNSQGTGSVSLPSTSYTYFYPFQQRDGGANYPGVLSGTIDNIQWSPV